MRNRVRLTMLRSLRLVWLRTTLLCELNCARLDTKFLITHALVFVVAKWAWYSVNCYLSERSMLARKNPLNPLWMYQLITFATSFSLWSIMVFLVKINNLVFEIVNSVIIIVHIIYFIYLFIFLFCFRFFYLRKHCCNTCYCHVACFFCNEICEIIFQQWW